LRYLCLAYYDERKFDALAKSELDALVSRCPPHDAALRRSGRLLAVGSLRPPGASTSLRARSGKVSVADGPFVESAAQVGAFFLIEAENLDEAIELASKHPAAHLGEEVGWGIEVRPIATFEQPPPRS
jgi:hypothetical protein